MCSIRCFVCVMLCGRVKGGWVGWVVSSETHPMLSCYPCGSERVPVCFFFFHVLCCRRIQLTVL